MEFSEVLSRVSWGALHCVDPYYLTYKAAELGFNSRVILSGRYINDNMGNYVSKKILQHVIQHSDNVKNAKILFMGITFKENVSDIRNSKVADVIKTLQSYNLNIFVTDSYADSKELQHEYGYFCYHQLHVACARIFYSLNFQISLQRSITQRLMSRSMSGWRRWVVG